MPHRKVTWFSQYRYHTDDSPGIMQTLWHGNFFLITGLLRGIPLVSGSSHHKWPVIRMLNVSIMFSRSVCWTNSRVSGGLRPDGVHVTSLYVMISRTSTLYDRKLQFGASNIFGEKLLSSRLFTTLYLRYHIDTCLQDIRWQLPLCEISFRWRWNAFNLTAIKISKHMTFPFLYYYYIHIQPVISKSDGQLSAYYRGRWAQLPLLATILDDIISGRRIGWRHPRWQPEAKVAPLLQWVVDANVLLTSSLLAYQPNTPYMEWTRPWLYIRWAEQPIKSFRGRSYRKHVSSLQPTCTTTR